MNDVPIPCVADVMSQWVTPYFGPDGDEWKNVTDLCAELGIDPGAPASTIRRALIRDAFIETTTEIRQYIDAVTRPSS